ncbi:MAG TPA: cytochrome c maturation protein CcmE [Saprospiraceae bacterium]|nr:cytochrome c maturation protein CcmE [Saprospiraceae bacterium]
MKRIHIISILLIAGAIALLISASGDMSTYSTFSDARKSEKKVKIAGQLAKDKDMIYNPDKDPNHFSFYLSDQAGEVEQVTLLAPKPQDFELSEQVVVTGKWKDDTFAASSVLLKCPSKYKNEEVFLKG